MNKHEVINQTIDYVRNALQNEYSGHDWWHIQRVYQYSVKLAEEMEADIFICSVAALLHDLADEKVVKNEQEGLENIRTWLQSNQLSQGDIFHIMDIIQTMSFKGGNNHPMRTLEGMIVQDADRLDALGAIGIARTFAYSGAKGRLIYDPNLKVRKNMTLEEYRNGKDTAINHFYEKLLKLKSLMNTNKAREYAEERHKFLEIFLNQFLNEWEGKK